MGRLTGKTALVTGAGSGIGLATAIIMAAEGAVIIVTDIDGDAARKSARTIGSGTLALEHDVSNDADWQRVAETVIAQHDRLDIVVNNAGTSGPRKPQDPEFSSLDTWDKINRINIDGVVLGCRHAISMMKKHGGAIVNISSLAANMATPDFAPYGAGKAAVRQFSKSVALYCARKRYNIRCNSVLPGFIETPMGQEALEGSITGHKTDPEIMGEKIKKTIPLRAFGQPEDIAYAVLYLASNEARFVTGTDIIVDGGVSAK
ncbi:3-oxoacyl-[acyl-carrier protein] reductase [hydrothermal vent metagenome]|uniref:3-oxoacyl-[acyl-carrier protein] reductase n=1 Tax=hydrothermal vent metagenome TaxID=652676 RepID=A0A3B0RIL0_9ZZZZ